MPPDTITCEPLDVHCKHDAIVDLDAHPSHPKNDNTHPPEQLALFEKILRHQGIRRPAVVSKASGHFVTGHGLRETLRAMGIRGIPVDYQDFASPEDEVRHLMADNKLAELAIRDSEKTLANLTELQALDMDMTIAGFTDDDLAELNLNPDEDEDGFDDQRGGGDSDLSDTQVQIGEYRIKLPRGDYLAWQEELREKVGFEKRAILKEIKRRLRL